MGGLFFYLQRERCTFRVKYVLFYKTPPTQARWMLLLCLLSILKENPKWVAQIQTSAVWLSLGEINITFNFTKFFLIYLNKPKKPTQGSSYACSLVTCCSPVADSVRKNKTPSAEPSTVSCLSLTWWMGHCLITHSCDQGTLKWPFQKQHELVKMLPYPSTLFLQQ